MINVLIVTYYCTNNYGSFLQAYSLGKYLEKHGCSVTYWGSQMLEDTNGAYETNEYRTARDAALSEARKDFKIDYECKEKYDLIIVGSDVVWASPKIKPFWTEGLNGRSRASYAASMHGMNNLPLPGKVKNLIEKVRLFPKRKTLKKFIGISVRDDRTYNSVKRLLGKRKNIVKVLDPTFLLDKSIIEEPKRIIDEKYILVYSYALVGEDINPVFEYAKKHNCKICCVGYKAAFADYNPACTPFELLSLFHYAEAVITTTFHGTALSIIMHGNFVTFESGKAKELLADLNLSDRMVTANTAMDILEKSIDYDAVDAVINEKKVTSENFLMNLINIAGGNK